MIILNEILDILNEAIYKPIIADIGGHLAHAGFDATPENIADIINKNNDIKTIKKEYNELTKKHSIDNMITNKFDKKVHQFIVGIYWLKHHTSKKTLEAFLNISNLDKDDIDNIVENHIDDIKKVFKDFKPSWIPTNKVNWAKEFNPEQRRVIVGQEILNLSKGKLASVTGMDLAKSIKAKYNLNDDIDSLRRTIDVILRNNPHLDKYRVIGRTEKSA